MEDTFQKYNNIYTKYQFININLDKNISEIDIFINNLNNSNNNQTLNKNNNKNLKNKSICNKYLFLSNGLYKFLLNNKKNFKNIIININEKMSYSDLYNFFKYIDIRKITYNDDNITKDFIELMNIRKQTYSISNKHFKKHVDNFILKYTSDSPIYQIVI